METSTTPGHWCTDEAAKLYATFPFVYKPTAVSWILEYYQQTHPEWSPSSSRIPLIVDVACGTGQLSVPLAEHCDRLIGVDISPSQVEMARQVSARPNVEYKTGSALELSAYCPTGGVDIIVVGMAAHHFDTEEFYSEVRRCLRPGGVLAIVSFWYPGIVYEDPQIATVFSRFSVEYAIDKTTERSVWRLIDAYSDLYCPVIDATRREVDLYPEMTREEVRNMFVFLKYIYRGGEKSIDAMMDSLPSQETYAVIHKVFGVFCHF